MKTLSRLSALLLLLALTYAAEAEGSRLEELVNAQRVSTVRARINEQSRPPRLAMQLDQIINQHDQYKTGQLSTPTNGNTSPVPTPLSSVQKFLKAKEKPLDFMASSSIRTGKDPAYFVELQNQMEPLENDYELILENFKKIGCFQNEDKSIGIESLLLDPINGKLANNTKESNPYSLCDGDLADQLFIPLGDVNKHGTEVFDHFNKNVYQPLSYKVFPNRFSFADALQDMLKLDKDNLMIKAEMPIPDFSTFQSMILGGFAEISNYSSDFDANKPVISKLILDILKHFHIYWNVKRQQNQVDSTKINTYSILKSIVKQYRLQNVAMKATTVHILNAIRDAYFRFMKAHKNLTFVTNNTQDVLGFNILKRYDNFIQTVLAGGYFQFYYIAELGCMIEFFTTYVSIDVSKGIQDADAYGHFYTDVYKKLIDMYNVYAKWMLETRSKYFDLVTESTAGLLLKIQHRGAVLIAVTSMNGFAQAPAYTFKSHKHSTVTTFFELMDYWMLIPHMCENYPGLQTCMNGLGNEYLWRVRQENKLQYSVTGMNLFIFLKNCFQQMIDAIAFRNGFNNFQTFKNLYFAELFRTSENIRVTYRINDMTVVDRLQNKLGQIIEKKKTDKELTPELLRLLGRLDDGMYYFFLKLREAHNNDGSLPKNTAALNQIKNAFAQFLDDFKDSNSECNDVLVVSLFPLMKEIASEWSQSFLDKFASNIHDSVALMPGSELTPLPAKDSVIVENIVKEPQIDTGATSPIFMGFQQVKKSRKAIR